MSEKQSRQHRRTESGDDAQIDEVIDSMELGERCSNKRQIERASLRHHAAYYFRTPCSFSEGQEKKVIVIEQPITVQKAGQICEKKNRRKDSECE